MRLLETERTLIETVEPTDAKFFLKLLNTPLWLRFIGDRNVRSIPEAERFLENGLLRTYREKGYGYYLIRTKDGNDIGTCGFMKKGYLENDDFGFAFLPDYHGQGFALEACRQVLDYGLNQIGLSAVDAVTDPENERSISLLEKLGFEWIKNIQTGETDEALEVYRILATNSV